jgi:quinoprotein glucose dehydrogenase
MMYVAAQSGLSTTELGKDPCSEHRYTQASGSGPRNSCGKLGAPDPPPGYTPPARGGGAGRGQRGGGAGGGRGAGAAGRGAPAPASHKDASPGTSTLAGGRGRGSGVSIVKPRELGGITAYNMNSGDKAWWIPNGGFYVPEVNPDSPDAAMFKNVKLIPQSSGGQPQVITTRTLVIYGTGRNGGPPGSEPRLFAVDKATGKEVGAVTIPARTSAPPMTFLHQGRQYIVFATGAGQNTALVALALR